LRGGVSADPQPSSPVLRDRRLRVLGGLGLALAAAVVVWLLVRGDDDSAPAPAPAARIVSENELVAFATRRRSPVLWAGPQPGTRLELTSAGARTYVRYLPRGVDAGDERPRYLSVATYGVRDPVAALRAAGAKRGVDTFRAPGGGLALVNRARPTSVYVAYPGSTVEVEVFSPSAATSRELVRAGRLAVVGGGGAAGAVGPRIVDAAALRRFAKDNGEDVFWVGARPGRSLELTRTLDGRVYVRYLPAGVRAGDRRSAFLTVATYRVPAGRAALARAAKAKDAVRIPVAGGGEAVFNRGRPQSVYAAGASGRDEVEVFSPVRGQALSLVTAGRAVPVR
jgi:hypothetical protein